MVNGETRTSFICSLCGLRKGIKFLNSVLAEKADLAVLEKQIENKEEILRDLRADFISTIDNSLATTISHKIGIIETELLKLTKKAEKSKREICSLCAVQGTERVKVETFVCQFCNQEKRGGGLKRHIEDWESRGIYYWNITTVCRQCQNDYAFSPPANFYCPLTSSGRDFDGSIGTSRFDCSCEQPE